MDKEKEKLRHKRYYKAHKEKYIASAKAWYKANKEKVKARQKANKEKTKTYMKVWREAHPEYFKTYVETHREELKISWKHYRQNRRKERQLWYKKWLKNNADKNRGYVRKRRARKHTTQIESINEKVVYLRDGWKCWICHKKVNKKLKRPNLMSASLDHIIPLSQGGTHTYANVQLAHLACNLSKQNDILPQGEQLRIF